MRSILAKTQDYSNFLAMFFKKLFLLTILVSIGMIGAQQFAPFLLHEHAWYALGYNLFLTLTSYYIYQKGLSKETLDFPKYFMGASAFRLLFSAIVLLLYIIWAKSTDGYTQGELIHFMANFFVFYILFTVFEISSLLSKLRQNSKDSQSI